NELKPLIIQEKNINNLWKNEYHQPNKNVLQHRTKFNASPLTKIPRVSIHFVFAKYSALTTHLILYIRFKVMGKKT
ncbi:MAG: hypothetical protein ABIO60_03460, partial [Aquaticitalea sp.]